MGGMFLLAIFPDSCHPRSLKCPAPEEDERQTATRTMATQPLSGWFYENGFTEKQSSYAKIMTSSFSFRFVSEMK
jgi:hypothetical protein